MCSPAVSTYFAMPRCEWFYWSRSEYETSSNFPRRADTWDRPYRKRGRKVSQALNVYPDSFLLCATIPNYIRDHPNLILHTCQILSFFSRFKKITIK